MNDRLNRLEQREDIRSLVNRSAKLLDSERFDDFVALFTPNASYTIEAYSPEIERKTIWLSVDREQLAQLLRDAPQHIHDLASRFHIVTVDEVDLENGNARSRASFVTIRTDQRGQSSLYAAGHYDDVLVNCDSGWLISRRTVRVGTRMLQVPTPMPL